MLIDTQSATHQHLPASDKVREEWVTAQLIGVVIDSTMTTLFAAAPTLLLMIYLMVGEVHHVVLIVWAGMLTSVTAYKFRHITQFRLRHDNTQGAVRRAFFERHAWIWAAHGMLWGVSAGILLQQNHQPTVFLIGLVVLGHGVLALTVLSAYFPLFNRYVGGLSMATIAGLLLPDLLGAAPQPDQEMMMLRSVLMLGFWLVLYIAGRRLYTVRKASFALQFFNQELIASLTQQTQAALRAVATKNRFLASAAHDLRQPVHALSLYADWLGSEPEMGREIAPRILQSTRAINELFDSLFDLTRIDAGNYKVRLQQVDAAQLLIDLSKQYEHAAQSKSLSLRLRVQPTTLWADPVVLRRMLGNLISNALRHTPGGGVLIALRQRENLLVFEVWDTGVGIAPEHQQAIFQEFFRISAHQGTENSLGLGLTVVSKLATLMGYQLSLNSVLGQGSVFRVMLPALTGIQAGDQPTQTAQAPPLA